MIHERSTQTGSTSPVTARVLDSIRRTRQSHALEHATIHILSRHHPGLQVMGRSTPAVFYIYGDVETPLLASSASEALARLQAGESHLAIHPRCGTNLAIGALLSGIASMLVFGRRRRSPWEELPQAFLAISGALFLAQPVGYSFQQHVTTTPDVHDVRIGKIERQMLGNQIAHHISLERD